MHGGRIAHLPRCDRQEDVGVQNISEGRVGSDGGAGGLWNNQIVGL